MTSYIETEKAAEHEKNTVALSSVLAAIFITGFKLLIGLLTHSLGILAEAAHSALDLVAAAVTFFAVRISGRAPDEKKMFGYGKVENLSALFETFFLFVTCVWIIYEAVQRLFFKSVEVEISIWSFIVMATSIVVDVSRSRALMRAAKKHGSQALEADALHFSTDVWSSSVVIGGLALVTLGNFLASRIHLSETALTWFHRADAIAALGVSFIVIYVSYNLGKRTIEGLLDSAPEGLRQRIIDRVSQIPGILKIRQVRIRPSGPSTFVDMILEIPRSVTFEQAHNIGVEAKAVVKSLIERVDVIIHMDPMTIDRDSIIESIQSVASRNGLRAHSIRVNEIDHNLALDMHVEVPESQNIEEAHNLVNQLEDQLRIEISRLEDISIHIEPLGDQVSRHVVNLSESDRIREAVASLPREVDGVIDCHSTRVYAENDNISISFHCTLPSTTRISEAHKLTADLERQLRLLFPDVDRIYIHAEPPEIKGSPV